MRTYLRRFERWLNQMIEAGLPRLLGARTQPVDLARRLADHMEDQRTVGAGRLYVPNIFRVYLSPETLSGFASFESGLEDELSSFLSARAKEADLHFVGRVRVTLLADPEMKPERIRIESDLVDRRGVVLGESSQNTQAIPVQDPSGQAEMASKGPELVLLVGRRHIPLGANSPLGMGRALDNAVILDEVSVSRHHARLIQRGEHWMLEDLGSTHGSFVNGHQISASLLREGDRIQLGSVMLQLVTVEQAGRAAEIEARVSSDD
jgi:hypothetical protein